MLCSAAALLLAACTSRTPKTGAEAPEPRTEVRFTERIALLPTDPEAGLTVNEALRNRRSSREYSREELTLEELSGVLWAAAGINRPENDHLTAPSALGLYPIRVYAFFADGIYAYDAK